MKNKILIITFLITLSSCQDNIKNLELYHSRSTGTLLMKLSDNQLYTAECYTYGEKVCYTEEWSKKMKIVEKKCFDFGNNCFFKIESLEKYKFNNSLKTSRFALLQLKREGGKYHLTSTNLKYDEKVINDI